MYNMYDFFLSAFTLSDLKSDLLNAQASFLKLGTTESAENFIQRIRSRLSSSSGGPHHSRSDINTTREVPLYNKFILVALYQSALMAKLGQGGLSARAFFLSTNKFTIRCNLKNWNGDPCQIVQVT